MLRRAAAAAVLEGAYQLTVSKGSILSRESFVALGLHKPSRNVELYRIQWAAMGELISYRRMLATRCRPPSPYLY